MRDFRKYEIYNDALDFVEEIYKITREFPSEEKYGLTNQLRRATVSIPSNIAEGASRKSPKDFSRFLEIALGSSFEIETQLKIAERLGYFQSESTNKLLIDKLVSIQKQLNGFRNKLNNEDL